jgi:hypothetical protein
VSGCQQRRFAALDQIGHLGTVYLATVSAHLVLIERGFEKCDVGADRPELAAPLDGFIEADTGARVGARHDEDLRAGVAHIHRRTDAHHRLVTSDHGLAFRVPAALGRHLILQHDGGKAGACITFYGPLHVLRAAEAGVAVANQRNRDRAADVPRLVEQFSI